MLVPNTLDQYTMLMGLHTMDAVITMLATSGLAYVPFFAAFIISMVEAWGQGEDEGNAGELAIKFLRARLIGMMTVFFLAFIPYSGSASITILSHSAPVSACEESYIDGASAVDSTVYGSFTGASNYAPPWWAWINDMSVTTNNVVLASMPCAMDTAAIQVSYGEASLPNATDQQVASAWNQQCLKAAAAKVSQSSTHYNRDWWVGHEDFLEKYASSNMTISSDMAASLGLSSSVGETTETSSTTTLNCMTAYQYLLSKGRSAASNNPATEGMTTLIKNATGIPPADAEDYAASLYFADIGDPTSRAYSIAGKAVPLTLAGPLGGQGLSVAVNDTSSFTGSLKEITATLVAAISNTMHSADSYAFRQGIPMQVSMTIMVLMGVLPLIILMSGYDIKVCLLLSGLYFGLRFTPAIAGLAAWADSIMHLVTGGEVRTFDIRNESAITTGIKLYEDLPKAWFVMLGLIGVTAINMGFNNLANTGAKAIEAAMKVARAAVMAV